MRRVLLISLLATTAIGLHAETFVDTARVRSVDPQYETVSVPRQECSRQWVNQVQQTGGEHQYGGAVVGAFTGDSVANRDNAPRYQEVPREVTSCRMVNDVQTRIAGYRVGYDYHGQSYTTLMRENPGPALRVRVSVDPIVGQ